MGHNSTEDPRAMTRTLFDVSDDDPLTDYGRAIAREQRRQNPDMIQPGYFLVRGRKGYPTLPAKIWLSQHEPGNPENLLERPVLMAEVADRPGQAADPIGVHAAIIGPLGAITFLRCHQSRKDGCYGRPNGCENCDRKHLSVEETYLFHIDEIRWARAHATTDPAARHQRRVDLTMIDPIGPPSR